MRQRLLGLLSFLVGSLWFFFWEFIRSMLYERLSHKLTPSINAVTLDQILHWGPSALMAAIGGWLFWKSWPSAPEARIASGRRRASGQRATLSKNQKLGLGIGALLLVAMVGPTIMMVARDRRNLTDREIAIMASRLEPGQPIATRVRISCVFDDPASCEYALRWKALFERAHWPHIEGPTPIQDRYDGIRIFVQDPKIDGYYKVITSFALIGVNPQVYVMPVASGDQNEIHLIVGVR